MSALVFVDTSVFLYAVDASETKKQYAARQWRDELWRHRLGRTSFQVLHDLQHGQDLDGIAVINPFRSDPSLIK